MPKTDCPHRWSHVERKQLRRGIHGLKGYEARLRLRCILCGVEKTITSNVVVTEEK